MHNLLYIEPLGKMWGSERSLLLLLKHLDAKEYQASACVPRRARFVDELKPLGLRALPWLPPQMQTHGVFSRAWALAGLVACVLATNARLIHLNQAGFVRSAYLVARCMRRPLVVHVRLTQDVELVARRVKCWRRIVCIANSTFVGEELKRHGVQDDKIFQITNPIEATDTVSFAQPRRWHLGFVGRLSRDKGIEVYLQTCQRVVQAKPKIKAVVVGSSGGQTADGRDYLEAMKDLAKKMDLAENVEFLGYREDVSELMRQIEIFLMPSYAEPWGRVVAEAMMAGAAVVASNAGGPREMITDGENGLLVAPGSPGEMAGATLRLIEDPEFARKLALAGRQWVEKECDPALHATKVMQIYQALLK